MDPTRRSRLVITGTLAVALAASLATTGVLLVERSTVRGDLAAAATQVSDRDGELAERGEELEAARAEREELTERVEGLEAELADRGADLAEAEEAAAVAEESRAQAAAAPAPAPPPSQPAADAPNACDQLGGFHHLGSDGCAELIREMEACENRLESDPAWVHFDGGLWEHVETGEMTSCDV